MSNFDFAFEDVIGLEGGYVNDPVDKGGETKYGIAKRWYPNVDIKNLTLEEAKQIYWRDFWNPLQLALIKDRDIAAEIFEQAVNMGRSQAAFHVQTGLVLLGEIVVIDRYLGQASIAAIERLGAARKAVYLKVLNGLQFVRYLEIVKDDPSQKRFFVGWLKRVASYG